MDLEKEVKKGLKGIIESYGFSIKKIGENELVLLKGDFALWFFYYYREGVTCSYLHNDGKQVFNYQIEAYLRFKRERGWVVASITHTDKHVLKIASLALTLEQHAKDIINGEKDWLKDYKQHYPLTPVSQKTAIQIWGQLGN